MTPEAFHAVAHGVREPLILVEASGEVLASNPAADQYLPEGAHDLAEVCGRDLRPYLSACSRSREPLPGSATIGGRALRMEGWVYRPWTEAGAAWVVLRLVPQEDATQRFLMLNEKIAEMSREIEHRRRAEEEVKRLYAVLEERVRERTHELAEANLRLLDLDRARSEFLASMSHELRTPLNAILGFTDLLLDEVPGPLLPEQKRQVGMVLSASEHLLRLIEEMLDIARIESGRVRVEPSAFPLSDLVDEVVETVRPLFDRRGLHLRVVTPETPVPVVTDRMRVRQVLLNLLGNAAKFTSEGGAVVRFSAEGGGARVLVSDSGRGIPPEHIHDLFQPFRKLARDGEGAGLGLYLCRKLVSLLEGEIGVDSRLEEGTTFWFTIPGHRNGAATGHA